MMDENKDFVDMCAVCKQGVPRADMIYQKGKVFHSQCFTEHGNTIPTIDPDLAHLSARTRIELVQLKNLKIRTDLEEPQPGNTKKSKPAKRKKHPAKKKTKAKRRLKKIVRRIKSGKPKLRKAKSRKAKKAKSKKGKASRR